MNPLLLLAIGLAIVLGGILWLRLHPFLSLILGAFAVGGLTMPSYLQQSMAAKYEGDAIRADTKFGVVAVYEALASGKPPKKFTSNTLCNSKEKTQLDGELHKIYSDLNSTDTTPDEMTIRKHVKAAVLAHQTIYEAKAKVAAEKYAQSNNTLNRITDAFGSTAGKIGILIAMACVIGRCLLASGAAERIVRGALSFIGLKRAPVAFCGSAFLLGIPVFFDSLFLLAIPIVKATWLKVKKNYVLFVVALVAGGTMTHSLVPPTPGPLFVAEELDVNLGTMIMTGLLIGICCSAMGLVYAHWLNKRMEVPLRESPEELAKLEELSERDISELPSLGASLLPILLPVVLISGVAIYKSGLAPTESLPLSLQLLGDKNIALTIAAAVAMLLAATRLNDRQVVADHVQQSMMEGGLIILICCAGGAFGAMLRQSGIGPEISGMTEGRSLGPWLLPIAFIVTAVIRGAQGSATVAMFTAVAIVGPIALDTELSYHPVYLAVAIGCGSKPFPWMNDSGFWVISKMSGMTEKETLKALTPMATIMGFTGIIVTIIAAKLFPMV
ncbi:MAG: gluconate transporter [Verrucomicrobiales bacterium]|nr:gluconate transporter [Verrucomicrobiales bacterium]